jgi:hypothetical protein
VSCVAEKKGKKPVCGTGEEFNKVSQKCINVRRAPTSTLETVEVLEDSAATTFTLKYTDVNNDEAIDCQVFDTETDLEIRSPIVSSVRTDALAVLNQSNTCTTSINSITFPTESATAIALMANVQSAYDSILSTEDTIGIYSALNLFNTRVTALANHCESINGQPITQYQGTLAKNLANELNVKAEWVNKRCYCSAGTCTAELIPGENKNGDYGISYNITEGVDGTSLSKQVQVSIIPVNDLPIAVDFHVAGLESVTTSSLPLNFNIPLPRDVESDQSFSLTYEIVSPPTKGIFTSCALANDGSLPNDTSCFYIPTDSNDGVASPLINKLANLTIVGSNTVDGISFVAKAGGTSGDGITVYVKPHPLLNSGNNVLVETSNRDITIYVENDVTNIKSVVDAVNNDLAASSMVTAVSTNVGTELVNRQLVTASAISLSSSNTPFDTFTYRVSDGQGYSAIVGYGSVDIELQDDLPVAVPVAGADIFFTEDTAKTITLAYTDSENDTSVTCAVDPTDAAFTGAPATSALIETSTCACIAMTQTCSVTLKPRPDFTGTAYFKWNITNSAGQTTTTQNTVVLVSGVNDVPFARYLSTTGAESAVAAVGAPYTFTFTPGIDIEGTGLTYQYVNDGTINGGTLTGCVDGANNINIGSTCSFTPKDGNINGVSATLANASLVHNGGTINYTAKSVGDEANNIRVRIIDDISAANYIEYIKIVNNVEIEVYVQAGVSDLNSVKTAIDSHIYASELVSVTVPTNAVILANQTSSLMGAELSAHKFNYTVSDGSLTSQGTFHINITPTDDSPVICPYSTFPDVKECGLGGCIDTDTPMNKSITPSKADIVFYDQSSSVCYKSVASGSSFIWQIVSDFTSIIPAQSVHQNGSFKINNIKVDEGGADTNEDGNFIRIEDIVISDGGLGLIPKKTDNLKIYYNDAQVALSQATIGVSAITSGNIEAAATTSDMYDFAVEITPAAFKLGQAVVTITFAEYSGATKVHDVSVSIQVNIEDIAIQHNGWASIIASGPKVDNFGAVQDSSYVCNYSETKCNSGGSCYGDATAFANASADQESAIFYNTTDSKCYYATAAGSSNWREFESYCGATPSFYDSSCSSTTASCLASTAPAAIPQNLNTLYTQAVYDSFNNKVTTTCYRSSGRDSVNAWESFKGFGEVLLKWEAMLLTGSGSIVGYNIFRRLANEDFDYSNPINKTLVPAATTQYIDNTTESFFGPVPNTVYYYEVVPVVTPSSSTTQFQIRTSDFNSRAIIRVLVPGDNRSLVPRDIVNITMCKKLNDSAGTGDVYVFDAGLNTYTCTYEGPGDNGSGQFDIGKDLIVDRFEAGCPYTKSTDPVSSCSSGTGNIALDGSCIGVVDPTVTTVSVSSNSDQIYYNRATGKCYELTAGLSTWTEVDSLATFNNLVSNYSSAHLPPLTNITQDKANTFCQATSTEPVLGLCEFGTSGTAAPAGGVNGDVYFKTDDKVCYVNVSGTWIEKHSTISGRLPSRKEQIAYSEWDYSLVSDSTVNTREGGLSLNSNSKCNTTSANGLESFFTDDVSPVVNSIFTISGTSSSGIRSVMTGSTHTKDCSSKYGIQDTIGNVTEWAHDRMACATVAGNSFCQGVVNGDTLYIGTADNDLNLDTATYGVLYTKYQMDGISGPCIDANSDGDCDGFMTEWIFDQKSNGASRFIIPMGLPLTTSFITASPGSFINFFFEQIGISSGITSTQLHDDTIIVNQGRIDPDAGANPANDYGAPFAGIGFAGLATGGSYTKGNGSGTYHLEMVPMTDTTYNSRSDIGFRCVAPVPSAAFIE